MSDKNGTINLTHAEYHKIMSVFEDTIALKKKVEALSDKEMKFLEQLSNYLDTTPKNSP